MKSNTDISLVDVSSGMYVIQLKSTQGDLYIGNVKFLKKVG
jgi:hypothetical protein